MSDDDAEALEALAALVADDDNSNELGTNAPPHVSSTVSPVPADFGRSPSPEVLFPPPRIAPPTQDELSRSAQPPRAAPAPSVTVPPIVAPHSLATPRPTSDPSQPQQRRTGMGAVVASAPAASRDASKVGRTELEHVTGLEVLSRTPTVAREVIRRCLGKRVVRLAQARTIEDPSVQWVTAAVVVRKFDAKVSANGGKYGVCRVWGADSLCAASGTTCGLLLAGAAFEAAWSRAIVGDVLLVTEARVQRGNGQDGGKGGGSSAQGNDVLLKCNSVEGVYVMGSAAGLRPCGFSTRMGDSCNVLAKSAMGGICSYHVAAAQREAKMKAAAPGPAPAKTKSALPVSMQLSAVRPPIIGTSASAPVRPSAAAIARAGQGNAGFLCTRPGAGAVTPAGAPAAMMARAVTQTTSAASTMAAVARAPLQGSGLSAQAAQTAGPGRTAGRKLLATAIAEQRTRVAASEAEENRIAALRAARERKAANARPPEPARPKPAQPTAEPAVKPSPARPAVVAPLAVAAATGRTTLPPAPSAFKPLPKVSDDYFADPKAAPRTAPRKLPTKIVGGTLTAAVVSQAASAGKAPVASADAVKALHAAASTASTMHKAVLDEAMAERERRRLAAIEQEDAAFRALDSVSEVEVTAFHCAACRVWSFGRPRDCAKAGHPVTAAKTKKRYYRCRRCLYSLARLRESGPPVGVDCPRCRQKAGAAATAAHYTKERRVDQHGDAIPDDDGGGGDFLDVRDADAAHRSDNED